MLVTALLLPVAAAGGPRGRPLPAPRVSYGTLRALDVHSTLQGSRTGRGSEPGPPERAATRPPVAPRPGGRPRRS
jgi:hypothetical protein